MLDEERFQIEKEAHAMQNELNKVELKKLEAEAATARASALVAKYKARKELFELGLSPEEI